MGHTCNLSAGKPETKGSQVQGQPRLHMAILSQEKKKRFEKKRLLHTKVHSSSIHNKQKIEITHMSNG
jgi:hypothetical protein